VLPLHPRTRAALVSHGITPDRRIRLIDPVGYLEMIQLEKNALVIVTDSGGVQKEAFFYAVPCVTLRNETEWVELLDSGWNRLAPPDPRITSPDKSARNICETVLRAVSHSDLPHPDIYGDGHAAEQIVKVLRGGVRRAATT
jgi:UDP-GlcNAc3NAcA epimerase